MISNIANPYLNNTRLLASPIRVYPKLNIEAIEILWINLALTEDRVGDMEMDAFARILETFMHTYLGISGIKVSELSLDNRGLENLLLGRNREHVLNDNEKAAIILTACSTRPSRQGFTGETEFGDWLRNPSNFLRFLEALANPAARQRLIPEAISPSKRITHEEPIGRRLAQTSPIDKFFKNQTGFANLLEEIHNISDPIKQLETQKNSLAKIYKINNLELKDKPEFSQSFTERDIVMSLLAHKNCDLNKVITLLPPDDLRLNPQAVLRSIIAYAVYMSPLHLHSLMNSEFDDSISPNFFYTNWLKLNEQLITSDLHEIGEIKPAVVQDDKVATKFSITRSHSGARPLITAQDLFKINSAYVNFKQASPEVNPTRKQFKQIIEETIHPRTISDTTFEKFLRAHRTKFPLTIKNAKAITDDHLPKIQSCYKEFEQKNSAPPDIDQFIQILINVIYPNQAGKTISEDTVYKFLNAHSAKFPLTKRQGGRKATIKDEDWAKIQKAYNKFKKNHKEVNPTPTQFKKIIADIISPRTISDTTFDESLKPHRAKFPLTITNTKAITDDHIPAIRSAYIEFKARSKNVNPTREEFRKLVIKVIERTVSRITIRDFLKAHSDEFSLTESKPGRKAKQAAGNNTQAM